ncbi:MAG: GNAT family N-acetyltransferase [Candidatus Hodarchaeales archaeon]
MDKKSFVATESLRIGFFFSECIEECNDLGLSRTHFLIDKNSNQVVGFIALSAIDLALSKKTGPRNDPKAKRGTFDHFPALKLDEIAVSKPYQRQGIGSWMIKHVIQIVNEQLRNIIGCKFIYSEIIENKDNISFFVEKNGFDIIPDEWTEKKIKTLRTYKSGKLTTVKTVLYVK